MNKKRIITKRQEQALKLVHQDFQGLEQSKAADIMGITQQAISRLLTAVEKVMPQYFPILTKLEAKVYYWYTIEGRVVDEIVACTEQSKDAVYKTLQRARDKGMYFSEPKGRVLSYEPSMDGDVKHKF